MTGKPNKTLPGKSSDYVVTGGWSGGIFLRGPDGANQIINAGYELHFEGDERDAAIASGRLVFEDGPVGGSGADPRVPVLEAKLAKVKADLAAILAGI